MPAIMSEEARRKRIEEAIRAHPPEGERLHLPWQNTWLDSPVVNIPLDAVLLNHRSHRIRSELESHPEGDLVRNSPHSDRAQEILSEILRETDKEHFDELKTNLKEEGQREGGVITRAGLLVNANRRAVALRELGVKYIRVAVLPKDASQQEIEELELRLQIRKEFKQEYTFTNQLLFVDELLTTYNRVPAEAALELAWAASRDPKELEKGKAEVDRAVRLLSLIREVQQLSGNKIPLTDFDDKRQALIEIDAKYQELRTVDPEEARRVRDARLLGVIAGVGYRELRHVNEDFLSDYLISAMEDSDTLRGSVGVFTPASPAKDDTVPGLDILDKSDVKGSQEPNPAPLLEILAGSHKQPTVELPGRDGPVQLDRDRLVDALKAAIEEGADEAKADKRAAGRLNAPIELLTDADRKLKRALEAYSKVAQEKDFERGKFKYLVKKIGRYAEALKAEVEKLG